MTNQPKKSSFLKRSLPSSAVAGVIVSVLGAWNADAVHHGSYKHGHSYGKMIAEHIKSTIENAMHPTSHAAGVHLGAEVSKRITQKAAQVEKAGHDAHTAFLAGVQHGAVVSHLIQDTAQKAPHPKSFSDGVVVGAESSGALATEAAKSDHPESYTQGANDGAKKHMTIRAMEAKAASLGQSAYRLASDEVQALGYGARRLAHNVYESADQLVHNERVQRASEAANSLAHKAYDKASGLYEKTRNYVQNHWFW